METHITKKKIQVDNDTLQKISSVRRDSAYL